MDFACRQRGDRGTCCSGLGHHNAGLHLRSAHQLWGGGGEPAQGNFVVQAVKGVDGDTRTVVLSPVATLYRLVDGTREVVGTLTVSPSASAPVRLDGGSQQFTFNDSSRPLVQGTTYFVSVVATGIVSDGALYTATLESSQYTAW